MSNKIQLELDKMASQAIFSIVPTDKHKLSLVKIQQRF